MYLSPRETFPLFNNPKRSSKTFTTSATQLCDENPDRVVLIFSLGGTVQCGIAPLVIADQTDGINLGDKDRTLVITNQEHGALSQVAWFAHTTGVSCKVNVFEVILERYPQVRGG